MRNLVRFISLFRHCIIAFFRSHREQAIVNVALQQQLAVYAQKRPRPKLPPLNRAFGVALSRLWSQWKNHLVVVRPETVVRWHRQGFRRYWRSISAPGPGRPPISEETRALIIQMATENCWRARKIQAELMKLGIRVSLATVSRYVPKKERDPTRTAFRSPWQNGTAERVVGSVRRELLDHVVVLNEDHLRRLLREYVDYHNAERVHTSIRDSPVGRPVESRPSSGARVVGLPRVGGLHHRYRWREAA
jgi:transposase InsO family protein